jgi:glycerol kinase
VPALLSRGSADAPSRWQKDHEWKPKMDEATRVKDLKLWKKAVTRIFDWVE